MIDGVIRIPLRRYEDERGWFSELRRDSALPKPMRQTNLSFSRAGVVRGLHYHERGQDDLFACLRGTARVVVLDRATGETFTEDIGDDNPVAIYIPGMNAHGFEALTDIVEKAGVVDTRYSEPPSRDAVVGLYCFPPDVFDLIERLEPSNRGELEITDVNRHYAQEGRLDVVRVEGWWEDAGKHWQHLAEIGRLVEETGANR